MSDETANGNIENIDDLEAFEKDFFGTKTAEVEEVAADDPEDIEVPDDDDPVDTEVDTDDEQDPEDADEDQDEPEPVKRNRKTAQERIKELTAEKYEAVRRENETLRRLQALEAQVAQPKEDSQEPAKVKEGLSSEAPSPDAVDKDGESLYPLGEFDPAYIRDLTRFTIKTETDNARKAEEDRRQQEAIQNARARANEVWTGRLEEAKKDVPDLVEKITSLATTFDHLDQAYGQYLVDVVQTLENGPQILAYLADNPKEAQQIVSSGATTATVSLGRLDARLAKAPKDKVAKVTAAPPAPSKTARGTGRVATSADTDDLAAFERQFFKRKN